MKKLKEDIYAMGTMEIADVRDKQGSARILCTHWWMLIHQNILQGTASCRNASVWFDFTIIFLYQLASNSINSKANCDSKVYGGHTPYSVSGNQIEYTYSMMSLIV